MRSDRPRPRARLAAATLFALSVACLAPATGPAGADGDPSWRHADLWDDGRAEFCVYEVDWPHYGEIYSGRALLVLVKEPWDPAQDVKADTPVADGYEVLKLNHVRDVPTGIYTYHQMASVFLRRDDGRVAKIASTSSESCGVSTARMTDGELSIHSYFDGVADRTRAYDPETLPQDGLPALLRDFISGELPDELSVLPSTLDSHLGDVSPRTLQVTRTGRRVSVPGGDFDAVELRLTGEGEELTYRFESEPPHRLLEYETAHGTHYRLAKCERIRYWTMNEPTGADWYPRGLATP